MTTIQQTLVALLFGLVVVGCTVGFVAAESGVSTVDTETTSIENESDTSENTEVSRTTEEEERSFTAKSRSSQTSEDDIVAKITEPELINSQLFVPREDTVTIRGTTTAEPGTSLRINIASLSGEETPFAGEFRGEDAPVVSEGPTVEESTWEITGDFLNSRPGTKIQDGTEFEFQIRTETHPDVLVTPGGEPIFGEVIGEPVVEALEITTQQTDGGSITVDIFEASRDATLQIETADGTVIGESNTLEGETTHESFSVPIDEELTETQEVTVVPIIQHPAFDRTHFEDDDERVEATALVEYTELQFETLHPQNTTVIEGESINTLNVTVRNIGDGTAEFEVGIEITDQVELGTQTVTLAGGESTTVTFENVDTTAVTTGEYEYQFFDTAGDDAIVGTLIVQDQTEPPIFKLSDLEPTTTTISQGDVVEVDVVVENAGGEPGTQDVVLEINGLDFTESITLDVNETTVVSFDVETPDFESGDYLYTVSSDGDHLTGNLSVAESETDDSGTDQETNDSVGDTGTDDDEVEAVDDATDQGDDADSDGSGFGVTIAAFALFSSVLLTLRRRVG